MRLEFQARTELTLNAVRVLADGTRWRWSVLAEHINSSSAYLAHLIAPLTQASWVMSAPGPTGGYDLTVEVDQVSLHDLIQLVERPTDDGRWVMVDRPCLAPAPCASHNTWTSERAALTTELESISLRQLITEQETPT